MDRIRTCAALSLAFATVVASGCGGTSWECQIDPAAAPDFTQQLGCEADFQAIASLPINVSIPGATSTKIVVDRAYNNELYFQNSNVFGVHYEFTSMHLSGNGLPIVPPLSQFNTTEYFSPDRRFILGSLTYYEGPQIWAFEIAPYDTASAELIETAYDLIRSNSFIENDLYFHPTSIEVERTAEGLPSDVKVITTDELFAGIDYQPLNLGLSMGRLTFVTAAEVETAFLSFRDIAVLDAVPNDISVTMGIITEAFQTPLSHINVLSQNRGTPNMALRGAFNNADLRALDGKWVKLEVRAGDYEVTEVTQAEADAWWDDNRPPPLGVPGVDLSVTELRNTGDMLDLANMSLGDAIDASIPAFGGKASHYGGIAVIGEDVPVPPGFGIPIFYYNQFMVDNGFDTQVAALLADDTFRGDPMVRDTQLRALRDAMKLAPVDPTFLAAVVDKINTEFPGTRMRFRSSTNAEDLEGFTGAGLYTSRSGDPSDPLYPVEDAIRTVWASVWFFRAFEEREFRGIDHTAVGMALLVHRSFPDEEANGVALTANIFDSQCIEPGFYINVQKGEESVVKPPAGVTTDQFVYHYEYPNQPSVFLSHSSLVPDGETVLTRAQTFELGTALQAIHQYFRPVYGTQTCGDFYAMDVEFKFDGEPGQAPALFVKQARPHPGWGL